MITCKRIQYGTTQSIGRQYMKACFFYCCIAYNYSRFKYKLEKINTSERLECSRL